MNATSLYIRAARFVLVANSNDAETWTELCQYLPVLRQSLSCCVCQQILHTPMGPTESTCQHYVCKHCVGGKMKLKPGCSWCKDFNAFVENPQLHIIVQCFRKLCEYLAASLDLDHLAATTSNGGTQTSTLMAIIQEGIANNDDYSDSTMDKTVNDAIPPKLHKENGVTPSSPTTKSCSAASATISVPPKETDEEKEETQVNGAVSPNIEEDGHVSPAPVSEDIVPEDIPPEDKPSEDIPPDDIAPECKVKRRVRRDRPRKRRRGSKRRPVPYFKARKLAKNSSEPLDSGENTNQNHTSEVDKSKHMFNNLSPKPNAEISDTNQTMADDGESHENNSDIPILKLSETVAIEHDYNKGLPSDEEEESSKQSPAPELIPAVPVDPPAEVTFKRKLERPAIHHDRTMAPKPPKAKKESKPKVKPGCRCGLATPKPGSLTCCGQRCPCYSAFKGCVDCRCRGCRNPRGDPAKNPLALQLQAIQQPPQPIDISFPLLHPHLRMSGSDESDIEIDI